MNKIKIYLTISAILYPLIFIAKYYDIQLWEKILVPTFVTLVFFANWLINPASQKPNAFLFLAFLFVCAGDYIVNLTQWGAVFIVPFVLVHVFLIIYFSKKRAWKIQDLKWLLIILAGITIIQIVSFPYIDQLSYKIVFILYSYLLSLMLWRATCYAQTKNGILQKVLIIGGALLFMITDLSVGLNIVLKTQFLVALTWICYVPALVMLSLMNAPEKK